MPSKKIVTHLVGDSGAIICQNKAGTHKCDRVAWDKLPKDQRCGNCIMVLKRREREGRRSGAAPTCRRRSTREDKACYMPRHGQV